MPEYIEREALECAFDASEMAFFEKEDHIFDKKAFWLVCLLQLALFIRFPPPTLPR